MRGASQQASERSVIVVGAGVIGVCCGYYLAKRGAHVTILERNDVGRAASFGNAGTIAPGHLPINKPGRVKQALRSLADPLSPLYVAPRFDPALVRWLYSFVRSCSRAHVDRSMAALAPLGHRTTELFQMLVEDEGLDCGYRRDGFFETFLTTSGWNAAQHEAEVMRQFGFHPEIVSREALREREPALRSDVVGGVYNSDAATVEPYRFVLAVAERARQRGATVLTGVDVVDIVEVNSSVRGVRLASGDQIQGESVVLATGAYSGTLCRTLGLPLPMQAGKGYHRDYVPSEGGAPKLEHTHMFGETSVFAVPFDGRMRLAGTLEFSGMNHDMRRPRLEQLTKSARRYLAHVGDGPPASEWCGLRPCLPDGLPAIGPVPGHRGVFLATGHAMLGLTLAPITGELIAESVLDGETTVNIAALSPTRFLARS